MMIPLFAVVATDAIGNGVILPLLPFYSMHFGGTPIILGGLLACFSLCQFVGGPLLGRASDRIGRKPLLVVSQLVSTAGLVLLALAHSLPLLFLARIIDGLAAGNIAVATAMAADDSDAATRRQAIGIVSAATGVGTMIGPVLGGLLTPFGISAPIWVAAALSVISMTTAALLLPSDNGYARGSLKQRFGKRAWRDWRRGRPRHPRMPASTTDVVLPSKRLIGDLGDIVGLPGVALMLAGLALFFLGFGMFTAQFALVLHARFAIDGHAFGPREIGLAYTTAGAIGILVQLFLLRPLMRVASDRVVAAAGFLLLAAGVAAIGATSSVWVLTMAIVVIGLGAALGRSALLTIVSLATPSSRQGSAMGIAQALGSLANVVAPLLAGLLVGERLYAVWAGAIVAIVMLGALLTAYSSTAAADHVHNTHRY